MKRPLAATDPPPSVKLGGQNEMSGVGRTQNDGERQSEYAVRTRMRLLEFQMLILKYLELGSGLCDSFDWRDSETNRESHNR